MTNEINGMAHVILTVSRFEAARTFYRKLLPEFGLKPVFDGEKLFYCVGARTAIGIQPCDPALAGERFMQQRVGLHHLCLRARLREDVDRCAALLEEMNATIVRGPMEGTWAPGYTTCCSRTRTVSDWKSITCREPGFWQTGLSSILPPATNELQLCAAVLHALSPSIVRYGAPFILAERCAGSIHALQTRGA
jgi:catechol 2,3-dioxygenase-like lactoylglutathione lyase family enzyme